MFQIALVPYQHDDDVAVCMLSQLIQPSPHIDERLLLADIIHQQRPHCSAVVRRRDRAVSLLASRVPNLSLDRLGVDLDASCGELYADCGFGIEVEFVPRETAQQVGLSDARVSDEDN